MSEDLAFDKLPESKDTVFLKTAGIHLGFVLSETEFSPPKEKDGVKTSGASMKLIFKNDKGEQFQAYIFEPPVKPEDVKFTGDVWENGVKVRKRTEAEQITAEFTERFYLFEQLAKAWTSSSEKFASFKNSVKGAPEGLFKTMFDKFFTVYTKEFYTAKKINFKLVYANNDKKKTSYLGLAKPSSGNLIFAPYTSDSNSMLQLSAYEEKNVVRKYSPAEKAPVGDNVEPADWRPVDQQTGEALPEGDLF